MTAPPRSSAGSGVAALLGMALLAALFAVDFHFDVRGRDALSWMDPSQYHEFALAVLAGSEHFDAFEVPSIFPFLLLPGLAIQPTIAAALWVNVAAMLLLLASVHGLCRELRIATPSPLVAALMLASPLLLGLSRSLYVEFTLTAVVALAFWQWLRLLRAPDLGNAVRFAAVFAGGMLLKMTFPLFFLLPAAWAFAARLAARRTGEAVTLAAAIAGPAVAVLLLQATLFSASFGYYQNLGNTSLPIMYLIGPPEPWSGASLLYYPTELGRTLLGLLAPLLIVAAFSLARRRQTARGAPGATAALWLWCLGPLLLLIAQPVKEPRHVAPCAIPAVLLLVMGIEAIPRRGLRAALLAAAAGLAAVQFVAVTRGAIEVPYFTDRPLHVAEIEKALLGASPDAATQRLAALRRRYGLDLAIAGFPADEALALTWWAFPGVVHDLDSLGDPARLSPELPDRQFEDPYLLAAFNAYNRRIGWRHFLATLPAEEVVRNADWVISNNRADEDPLERFPGHEIAATIPRDDGAIFVLRPRTGGGDSFRTLYARRFLRRHPELSRDEQRVIARELQMVAALTGERLARDTARMLPDPLSGPLRNIYWIGGYPELLDLTDRILASGGAPTR